MIGPEDRELDWGSRFLEHAAARLDDAEYLGRMARLRPELEIVGAQTARALPWVRRPT